MTAEIAPETKSRPATLPRHRDGTMRKLLIGLAALSLLAVPAAAADPSGDWTVKDGSARMRLADCNGKIWGIVAWAQTSGVDSKNPDPAQRNRPLIGLPILRGMQKTKSNQWEGPIYNPKNGKTYQGTITLKQSDVLEVEGCVLGGWICGGQNWTRLPVPEASTGSTPTPDLCLTLFGAARPPHQGGLK
jgi:uncharacterized protein (DUF2147 family)